jgi:hypothetical protein
VLGVRLVWPQHLQDYETVWNNSQKYEWKSLTQQIEVEKFADKLFGPGRRGHKGQNFLTKALYFTG